MSDGKCHRETQGRDRRINLNKMVREKLPLRRQHFSKALKKKRE